MDAGVTGLHPLCLRPEERLVAARVRLFRLILATAAMLWNRMDCRLAADGLTTQQAMLLHHLEDPASPPTITEVADRMAVSHQNAKQSALALEREASSTS